MTEQLDITNSLDRLIFNYMHARRSWECWCFMVHYKVKDNNPEIRKYVDKNDLLNNLRYLALKDFHIEITKILKESSNYKDNIFKLLKTLTNDNNPKKELALDCLKELNNCSDTINAIINARDKYYAHLDPEFKIFFRMCL